MFKFNRKTIQQQQSPEKVNLSSKRIQKQLEKDQPVLEKETITWPSDFEPLLGQSDAQDLPSLPAYLQRDTPYLNDNFILGNRSFITQQQQQYGQYEKQEYYPIIDKLKAFIFSQNLLAMMQAKNLQQGEGSSLGFFTGKMFYSRLDKSQQIEVMQSLKMTKYEAFCKIWLHTKKLVQTHFSVFDPKSFLAEISIPLNQIVYRVSVEKLLLAKNEYRYQNLLQQLCEGGILQDLVSMISDWVGKKSYAVYISFKIKGYENELVDAKKISYTTMSIDFTKLTSLIFTIHSSISSHIDSSEQVVFSNVQESIDELMILLGNENGIKLAYSVITKAVIQFYKVPKFEFAKNQTCLKTPDEMEDQVYKANMPLYSISRARVQYLGCCVPLFRYKHQLFESLICTIYERDIRPNFDEDFSTLLQDPILHEKFLVKKYLEFMSHPFLQPLLVHSYNGSILDFISHFNSLSASQCPTYSQFKIQFYDINQRKYIIQNEQGKDIYIVHYNGFVFGTNYSKMIVIREREEEEQEEEDVPIQIQEISNSEAGSSVFEISDGEESDIDIQKGFALSSTYQTIRYKKYKKTLSGDFNIGTLAVKMEFQKTENQEIPTKLVCYGSLPGKVAKQEIKEFLGAKCHLEFLLWILQNIITYKVDARLDSCMVCIYTIGGAHKELPWVMRGLVQITGRETHFYGDINKIKCIFYEGIKFYDLLNYFDKSIVDTWIPKEYVEALKLKSNDPTTQKVFHIFELARKFLREIQSIDFNPQHEWVPGKLKGAPKGTKFDIHAYQVPTSGSLSLSIFQYIYLDPNCEIRGTSDLSIFQKEQASLRPGFFSISGSRQDSKQCSVYQMNCLKAHIYKETPVPCLYKGYNKVNIWFDTEIHSVATRFWPYAHMYLYVSPKSGQTRQKYTIMYSSLYKVEKLNYIKESQAAILWKDRSEYVWGAEIIAAMETQDNCIKQLVLSEEITYFQSRCFSKFITDIVDKLHNKGMPVDPCQKDILEMILNQFSSKFTQRHFNLQQIVHVNDLKLLKSSDYICQKFFEIQYPYFYAEFMTKKSEKKGHMQQIGSLCRISSFLNACQRVHIMQSLSGIDKIVYLDQNTLIAQGKVKTEWTTIRSAAAEMSGQGLHQCDIYNRNSYHHKDLGKWQLQYQTSIQGSPTNQLLVRHLAKIQTTLVPSLKPSSWALASQLKDFERCSPTSNFLSWLIYQDQLEANLPDWFKSTYGIIPRNYPLKKFGMKEEIKLDEKETNFLKQIVQENNVQKILEKVIHNFEKSCMRYLNNEISSEQLSLIELRQKSELEAPICLKQGQLIGQFFNF